MNKFQAAANTTEIVIGTKTYRIQPLPLKAGRRLWFRLLKVITPMFGAMVSAGEDESRVASAMVDAIVANLSEDLFEEMVTVFAQHSSYVATSGADFLLSATINTTAFEADYAGLVVWLKESLRVNYGSFLAAIPSLLQGA